MMCVSSKKQDGARRERWKDWGIVPFETWQNWPSRSLQYQMIKNLRSIKETFPAHNNDLHYMNTWYAKKSGLSTMQKDFYKLAYILKEIMLQFFHTFIHFKETETLCYIVGKEHSGIWSLTTPFALSYISNNTFF